MYILLDPLLPRAWDSNAGSRLGGDDAACLLRAWGLFGVALIIMLFVCTVVEAEASVACYVDAGNDANKFLRADVIETSIC